MPALFREANMHKAAISFVMCLAAVIELSAQPRWELGVLLGLPTGLNVKYWFDTRSSVDVLGGWSIPEERLDLYVDYQYHFARMRLERGQMPLSFGIGAAVEIDGDEDGDTFLGARVPLGLSYLFANAPLSIFAEISPIVAFIPETEFDISGGVGVRFTIGSAERGVSREVTYGTQR
jgi:hypothetical protein